MPPPLRGVNNYRLYGEDAVERLLFIKQAKLCGFTLKEIGQALALIGDAGECGAGASILGKFYDFTFDRYFRVREGRADHEACSLCGLCARICPVSNIRIEAGKAVWGDHCGRSFRRRCLTFCIYKTIVVYTEELWH